MGEEIKDASVGRRALLRRGSAVAAGVVGLGVAEAVGASGAQAAQGDQAILGVVNDAGTATTLVTSSSADGTLEAVNTGSGPAIVLRTDPKTDPYAGTVLGSLYGDSDLYYVHDQAGQPVTGRVFTENNASMVLPVKPTRLLDTRSSGGRTNVIDKTVLDSSGRIKGGQTVKLLVNNLFAYADVVFFNVTAVAPTAAGFVTVWPGGSRPVSSTLNFSANQTIANGSVTGLEAGTTPGDFYVYIYAHVTTHVLFDVVAAAVPGPDWINPTYAAAGQSPTAQAAKAAAARKVAAGKAFQG